MTRSILTKEIFMTIPIIIEAIIAGERIVKLTSDFAVKIKDVDTGRLFYIHRFFPSKEIEDIVVQDVDIQNIITTGTNSPTDPEN